MHYSLPHQNPLSISFLVEIELMAYNSKAFLLVVGFLLATVLLGSSEVLTQEQLAQNHAVKTIHKEYSIGYRPLRPRPVVGPGRGPYTPGCRPKIYCKGPPTGKEINSEKPHH